MEHSKSSPASWFYHAPSKSYVDGAVIPFCSSNQTLRSLVGKKYVSNQLNNLNGCTSNTMYIKHNFEAMIMWQRQFVIILIYKTHI